MMSATASSEAVSVSIRNTRGMRVVYVGWDGGILAKNGMRRSVSSGMR
jgi:hypothetical protein